MMPKLRNFKLTIAYDGSGYYGWQVQLGVKTVQEVVEQALSKILGHQVRVNASGRTDTGVHALGQVINFHTPSPIPEQGLLKAMNSVLPPDISVMDVTCVESDFHARFKATSKSYAYVIDTSDILSPFLSRYVLHLPGTLDVQAMDRSADMIKGEHDFSSFMGTGSEVKTTIRTISSSVVFAKDSKVFFFIQGSGFLRHMVRNIVGTLILIGERRLSPEEMTKILDARDRCFAGPTAPPQGLYLVGVTYGDASLSRR